MIDETQAVMPEIDYLSRDYASFRQLALDHLATRVPEWSEPSAADVGNVLIETLAYAADYLSYYQDAVATEAYLGTARRRSSLKRHTRLLDYILHEGCNARAWVHMQVSAETTLPQGTALLTHMGDFIEATVIAPGVYAEGDAQEYQGTIFETMQSGTLYPAHNEMAFFVERGQDACLPSGCTSTMLRDSGVELKVGQALLLEEVKGLETGDPLDADPARRHIVLLTNVTRERKGSAQVVSIEWGADDALPFELTIARHGEDGYLDGIAVARGNLLLADHGRTIAYEPLPPVLRGSRYRPALRFPDLTYRVPDTAAAVAGPASAALVQKSREALPALTLFERQELDPMPLTPDLADALSDAHPPAALKQALYAQGIALSEDAELVANWGGRWEVRDATLRQRVLLTGTADKQLRLSLLTQWTYRSDLVSNGPLARSYCVDMEDDGRAFLRFSTRESDDAPCPDTLYVASYRVGRGISGNVSAEALAHIVTTNTAITQVRNPLPAEGGQPVEPIEEARLKAPFAFQEQKRCVTEEDYVEVACKHPKVANAAARLRWLGNWHTMFVYIQPIPGLTLNAALKSELRRYLEPFRIIGHEIEVCEPEYVALQIVLRVHLKTGAYSAPVRKMLEQVFGSGPGGFFAPGNFTFGQTIYVSQLITKAMEVRGIARVEVEQCGRLDEIEAGMAGSDPIQIDALEIVHVDNEKAPCRGTIQFLIQGGL